MPRACAASMMWLRLAVSCATGTPRRPSLAPSATHEHPHVALERAIEARARVRRRLSRDAGVHDLVWKPGAAHPLMQQRGIRDGGSDAVTRRQAVAEADDASHST